MNLLAAYATFSDERSILPEAGPQNGISEVGLAIQEARCLSGMLSISKFILKGVSEDMRIAALLGVASLAVLVLAVVEASLENSMYLHEHEGS